MSKTQLEIPSGVFRFSKVSEAVNSRPYLLKSLLQIALLLGYMMLQSHLSSIPILIRKSAKCKKQGNSRAALNSKTFQVLNSPTHTSFIVEQFRRTHLTDTPMPWPLSHPNQNHHCTHDFSFASHSFPNTLHPPSSPSFSPLLPHLLAYANSAPKPQ